ncbi:MAG: NAD(P)H-hydrate dehydratase [Sphingobacteriales bacterium]|nr:NAD(P)H-hydrate dehydratase [Sphingobacteriales bacterium]OJY81722.1 MAG: NAD(P)H-hydrate epimerase [Sphingobacteriales bacterium 44-15]
MKIFSAAQIKAWDAYTMEHEPVASADLMERAARRCAAWMMSHTESDRHICIFCGPGNNGGDGLAIARLLAAQQRKVSVYLAGTDAHRSPDNSLNLSRLQQEKQETIYINSEKDFPPIPEGSIIVDALYGYGLNRRLEGMTAALVEHLNASGNTIIAVDMPSGLFADQSSSGNAVIKATYTLSFQVMKLAFLLPENAPFTGSIHIIDIGLDSRFYENTHTDLEIVTPQLIHSFYKPRQKFSHKGSYGNAALIGGSYGMMGAMVLGAGACLRSGAGKLTCYIPACGYTILQSSVPEAMCVAGNGEQHLATLQLETRYDAIAAGPGMGQRPGSLAVLKHILDASPERSIIDADGLNLLASRPDWYNSLPANTILTPHPKEFERLFGPSPDQFSRLQLALEKAKQFNIYIVIKGNYSFIATPAGKGYFNPTGNPGMATAGSGDVLTGILLGLYAQSGETEKVVLTGVYLHGLAGDKAAAVQTEEAMISGDIINYLPQAFAAIKKA